MTNTYKIAERNIAVTSLHDEVHSLCADYLAPDAEPDFTVETNQADIDFERAKSAREDAGGYVFHIRCTHEEKMYYNIAERKERSGQEKQ